MRILANPAVLRASAVLILACGAFLLGLLFMRALKKKITEEADVSGEGGTSLETLPLHLYNTVIQQLKQQKHELMVQSQAEQNRARTRETLSQAVLSNLSCGVLVFGSNGLVKTSNPAAKAILGFASPTGMSAEDIFRGAAVAGPQINEPVALADEIHAVLREGSKQRQAEGEYETPAGEKRYLQVTISAVPDADGSLLGVACVINDRSEWEKVRWQQESAGQLSAEMAQALRASLAKIAGYAQQLANNRDPDLASQLAADIAHQAADLDHNIGGFLSTNRPARAAAAGGSTAS